MTTALSHFMGRLIDYAGLFPPAELGMDQAVAAYVRHRGEPERWMLGRFILPAARLEEWASQAAPTWNPGPSWQLSVLVGARGPAEASLADVAGQAEEILTCERHWAPKVRAAALEAPLVADPSFAAALVSGIAEAGLTGRELYLELPGAADDTAMVAGVAEAARSFQQAFGRIGAKLRCGGVTPEAFPSCGRVAKIIAACRDRDLPLKCTAGLHHPVRHRADAPDVMMHGFLNVFGAGLLAYAAGLDEGRIEACVAETDPEAFSFDDRGFAWRGHAVAAPEIARLRATRLCGFGSCSFDEPRADLVRLGLL